MRLQFVFKTFSKRFKDVFKTPSRRLEHVLKTSWRYLQDVFKQLQDVLQRCLRDIFLTFSRHYQDVFKMYDQVNLFLLAHPPYVFKPFSRRIQHVFETYWKDEYLQKDLSRAHFWEIYDQGRNFPRVNFLDCIPKLLKQFFKTIYEVTASIIKDILVKVGYQKRCCYLSK